MRRAGDLPRESNWWHCFYQHLFHLFTEGIKKALVDNPYYGLSDIANFFWYKNVAFPARYWGWVIFLFFCWFQAENILGNHINRLQRVAFLYANVLVMLPCVCSVINHRWRQNVVRTKKWHTRRQPSVSLMFLPHFDVFCDLSLSRRTAIWNLLVLYNNETNYR